jgi:cell shape-determining protein MreC
MQKRASLLAVFSLFLILSASLLFIFRQQTIPLVLRFMDRVISPVQLTLYSTFAGIVPKKGESEQIRNTNRELAKQIVDQTALIKEVEALRDQYDLDVISSQRLIPAKVIGMKSFIPGPSR